MESALSTRPELDLHDRVERDNRILWAGRIGRFTPRELRDTVPVSRADLTSTVRIASAMRDHCNELAAKHPGCVGDSLVSTMAADCEALARRMQAVLDEPAS